MVPRSLGMLFDVLIHGFSPETRPPHYPHHASQPKDLEGLEDLSRWVIGVVVAFYFLTEVQIN